MAKFTGQEDAFAVVVDTRAAHGALAPAPGNGAAARAARAVAPAR